MKILCIPLIFTWCIAAHSQKITGMVRDNKTNKVIAYALVSNTQQSVGISTSSMGEFEISPAASIQFDSLKVSAIGYKSVTIPKGLNDDIPLVVMLTKLDRDYHRQEPIENDRKKRKREEVLMLGAKSSALGPVYGCYVDSCSNNEIAFFIENEEGGALEIDSIGFFLGGIGVIDAPFRIRVYKYGADGKPGEELTKEDIIVVGYRKASWNMFGVATYNLVIPTSGCFVAMEWLNINQQRNRYSVPRVRDAQGAGPTICLTDEFKNTRNFRRNNWGEWYTSRTIIWNNIRVKDYNPMVRVKVRKF